MTFDTWISQAKRGERHIYFTGDLSRERVLAHVTRTANGRLPSALEDALTDARDAWRAYESGTVSLVRRRTPGHASDWFDYIAVRR
jgi:hypothetical protein